MKFDLQDPYLVAWPEEKMEVVIEMTDWEDEYEHAEIRDGMIGWNLELIGSNEETHLPQEAIEYLNSVVEE